MSKCNKWARVAPGLSVAAVAVGLLISAAAAQNNPAPATGPATTRSAKDQAPDGSREVALRLANLARETLRQPAVFPPHFKQAAALILGAAQLDPAEPSHPRALYEAMMMPHIRDTETARKALSAYRKLAPHDQHAMVAYIDLTLQTHETADERAEYLRNVMDAPSVPPEVRSHAAFRASQVARERADGDLEDAMLGQALRLNPLNLDALRTRLDQQSQTGTAVERVGTMLQMLRSNPVQPGATYRIARELNEAGMITEALQFYPLSVSLANATGTPMGREFALAYATTVYMGGHGGQLQLYTVSKSIAEQLLKQDNGDVEALLLQWYAQRGVGEAEKENAARTQVQIINAALNRLLALRQPLGVTGPGATTRPVDNTDPLAVPGDLSDDVKKLQEDPRLAELRLPYAQALADLTWYLVHVDQKPEEAGRQLPLLKALLGDKHPLVVRIEGFVFLAQNQPGEAKVKLHAVADQDVLARMGTILIEGADAAQKDKAMAWGRQLLAANPSGLLAVVVADGLKPLNVKLVERDDASALRQRLADFPKEWLQILEAPMKFYVLKAETVNGRVLFPFGEPIFAEVTIKNVGDYDITIGPDGVIRPDLWFDANLRGIVQQAVTGAAYERLAAPLVLKPKQTITQRLRLDQGSLYAELAARPQPSITFFASVRTNPRGEGGWSPGGYGVQFNSIIERGGFPLNDSSVRNLMNNLANGSPAERLRSLELMGVLAESIRQNQPGNQQMMALAKGLLDAVDRSRTDPIPGVATWAAFLTAVHSPERRQVAMDSLLNGELPERRLLGLLIANSLPVQQRKELTTRIIAQEKEPSVRMYAQGMLELAEVEAAAATRPTSGPAGLPGALRPAGAPTTGPATAPSPPPPATPGGVFPTR